MARLCLECGKKTDGAFICAKCHARATTDENFRGELELKIQVAVETNDFPHDTDRKNTVPNRAEPGRKP